MQPEFVASQMASKRFITGLDGLRTLAVLGVIVYHLLPATLQGGYLGVPIFLVITGYLITSHLIKEWQQSGTVKFGRFYWKRLTRLSPVLVTMLIATTAYITVFQRGLLHNIRATIWTNLVYVYNWWEIGHGESYFDRFSGESPFTHLWTLGVEAQFYLIIPVLIVVLFGLISKKSIIAWLFLLLSVVSAILMAVFYNPENINRVYYGTDTRIFAIFLGSFLAVIWPANKLRANINTNAVRTLDGIGIISIIIILISYFKMSGQSPVTYYGGMYGFSLMAMLLVAAIVHPGAHVNSWFTNPVFKWVGQRSYGIYVYQYPVLVFYESQVKNIANHPVLNALAELVIILVISELSYRFIEQPLLHYNWRNLGQTVKSWFDFSSGWYQWLAIVPGVVLIAVASVGLIQQPAKATPNKLQAQISQKAKQTKKHNEAIKSGKAAVTKQDAKSLPTKYALTSAEISKAKQINATAIGDSVLVDGSQDLQAVMPKTYVSAAVGRQIWQAPDIIHGLAAKGQLEHTVILNLGTNGALSQDSVDKVLQAIGPGHEIYWITAHVPTKNWQKPVNDMIHKTDNKHKNVHVIDWYSYSSGHPEWFSKDSVHPNDQGNAQFVHLIVKTVLSNQ
ncbi:acyltransferase family protein [Paucilactobacillus sp. N302-9]